MNHARFGLWPSTFGLLVLAALAGGTTAFAWTPPPVGVACTGARGPGGPVVRVAGNYLGGSRVRGGVVDWKSHQGCFPNLAACEAWLAAKAAHHPLGPGYARCTPVTLR